MIKKHKRTLILTSLLILVPMVIGLLLWDQLPDQVPFHWNIQGEVDNWASKPVAVFCMPALMLVMQWVCLLACTLDPKYRNYNPKMMKLVLWICPGISLVLNGMVYCSALGYSVSVEVIMPLLVGIMFVVMGNLLPKCRQTYTMGIKLPWTLNSEANWNATHRFGGKVWVIGGIVTILFSLFGSFWILMVILFTMVLLPTLYSYWYYRKFEQEVPHE